MKMNLKCSCWCSLFLVFLIGQTFSKKIAVEPFNGIFQSKVEGKKDANQYIGAKIIYGEKEELLPEENIPAFRSHYAYLEYNTKFHILFVKPKVNKVDLKINLFFDSGPIEKEMIFDKDISNRLCFVYGTWWPSSTEEVMIELYINFLTSLDIIHDYDMLYLSISSAKTNLSSSLLLREEKSKYEGYAKLSNSAQTSNNKQVVPKVEKASANHDDRTKIGEVKCGYSFSPYSILMGTVLVKLSGDGKFYMAFATKEIGSSDANEAAMSHASKKIVEYVNTKWADLSCLNNGVNFQPTFLTYNENLVKEKIEQQKKEASAAAQNKPNLII